MELSPITKLAYDLVMNGYKSGRGYSINKDYITHYTFEYGLKKSNKHHELTIPYEALKMLEMARDLVRMANAIIESGLNIEDKI